MHEQGTSSETQTEEKGVWNVERGAGHLGRIQECCQSIQKCSEESKAHLELSLASDVKEQQKGLL